MTNEQEAEVSKLKHDFDMKRHAALKAFLAWWDILPENKALKADLRLRCTEYGHKFKQLDQPTVFGYTWKACEYCHERIDIEGPPEQEVLDQVKPVGAYAVRVPNIPSLGNRRKSKLCPKCNTAMIASGPLALGMVDYNCSNCGSVKYFDRSGTWTINGKEFEQ